MYDKIHSQMENNPKRLIRFKNITVFEAYFLLYIT